MRQSRNAVVAVEEEVKQPELVREFTIPLSARKSLPVFYPVRNVMREIGQLESDFCRVAEAQPDRDLLVTITVTRQ